MVSKSVLLGASLVVLGIIGILGVVALGPRQVLGMDEAESIATNYLKSFGGSDIQVKEIMEFQINYYVEYKERSTGLGAFEMLIDKQTGSIYPEYGPNMMWNLKYGHGGMMGGWSTPPSAQMSVSASQAKTIAQGYLDGAYPGSVAEEVNQFYGYYTVHITKSGTLFGMLSVNGSSGVVWYHSWHGAYIQSREIS
ncbi:MAG: hypothetical protein Q8O47_10805 [Candidatus Bathyarchaeota archaeon]|nr:hypothetical protein [Candidatus Bathyarchaeota archaeon]